MFLLFRPTGRYQWHFPRGGMQFHRLIEKEERITNSNEKSICIALTYASSKNSAGIPMAIGRGPPNLIERGEKNGPNVPRRSSVPPRRYAFRIRIVSLSFWVVCFFFVFSSTGFPAHRSTKFLSGREKNPTFDDYSLNERKAPSISNYSSRCTFQLVLDKRDTADVFLHWTDDDDVLRLAGARRKVSEGEKKIYQTQKDRQISPTWTVTGGNVFLHVIYYSMRYQVDFYMKFLYSLVWLFV